MNNMRPLPLDQNSYTTFGEYVRVQRLAKGITQDQLLKAMDIETNRAWIINVEHDRVPNLGLKRFLSILHALQTLGAPQIDIYKIKIPA